MRWKTTSLEPWIQPSLQPGLCCNVAKARSAARFYFLELIRGFLWLPARRVLIHTKPDQDPEPGSHPFPLCRSEPGLVASVSLAVKGAGKGGHQEHEGPQGSAGGPGPTLPRCQPQARGARCALACWCQTEEQGQVGPSPQKAHCAHHPGSRGAAQAGPLTSLVGGQVAQARSQGSWPAEGEAQQQVRKCSPGPGEDSGRLFP